LGRWLAGGVIILVTVAAFVIYQSTQTLPDVVPDPTLMISPTLLPIPATNTPSQTPTPIEYRIVSSKANLSAVVTELYYAADGDNWDLTHLGQFAGHLEGTPTLGKGGNFVIERWQRWPVCAAPTAQQRRSDHSDCGYTATTDV